jgi:TolA-binding protein
VFRFRRFSLPLLSFLPSVSASAWRGVGGAFLVSATAGLLIGCSGDNAKKTEQTQAPAANLSLNKPYRLTPEARAKALHRVDSLEALVRAAIKTPSKAPDIKLAMYMIQAYQYFAADFPEDSLAARSLDRAGQLYAGVLGDNERAVEYYEKAYSKYPNYKNRPQLLLQQGMACEAGGDTAAAATAYQRLITGYPEKPMAAQARGLLKVMRMSAADRAKMFGGK